VADQPTERTFRSGRHKCQIGRKATDESKNQEAARHEATIIVNGERRIKYLQQIIATEKQWPTI
jgi:hypothetical protein